LENELLQQDMHLANFIFPVIQISRVQLVHFGQPVVGVQVVNPGVGVQVEAIQNGTRVRKCDERIFPPKCPMRLSQLRACCQSRKNPRAIRSVRMQEAESVQVCV
jgi:hypothetical protein